MAKITSKLLDDLHKAAAVLQEEAEIIRCSHRNAGGHWPTEAWVEEKRYLEMMRLVRVLRGIH